MQKEHGQQADDTAMIEKVNTHTFPNRNDPCPGKTPGEVSLPTVQGESRGQWGRQARTQLSEQSNNQIAKNLYKGEYQGDVFRHTVEEATSGTINPDTSGQSLQAPQDGVEDRIPISQHEAQIQDLKTDRTVPSETMEVLMRDEEEAILVEPVTQVDNIVAKRDQADTQMMRDVHNDASEGPI